jgi:hypothetical protein
MPKPISRGQALKDGYISKYQKKRIAYLLKSMKRMGYIKQENAKVKKCAAGV